MFIKLQAKASLLAQHIPATRQIKVLYMMEAQNNQNIALQWHKNEMQWQVQAHNYVLDYIVQR